MAKDNMEVIMYKILKYLYESLKAGHKTSILYKPIEKRTKPVRFS